ncbi:MAG: hypothetical protein FWF59_05140 [Turicibacter sp.]|nr:hypothetical protein [Turicibacter sp.]
MDELNAQKVNRWLFWIMLGIFGLITYLNFYGMVHRSLGILFAMPFWFLLTAGVLGTFLVLNWLGRQQHEMDGLEERLGEERRSLIALERDFRLVRQDPASLSPRSFKRYCIDVLRKKGFGIASLSLGDAQVDLEAFGPDGLPFYVCCFGGGSQDLRGAAHHLYYQMLKKGIDQGLVMVCQPVNGTMHVWAKSIGITFIDAKKAAEIPYEKFENA